MKGTLRPQATGWILQVFDAPGLVLRNRRGRVWSFDSGWWTFDTARAARRFARRKGIELDEPQPRETT